MSASANISLRNITKDIIEDLKILNQIIFPITYDNKYYKRILEAGEYAKVAYIDDTLVGVIVCQTDTTNRKVYISTLGCLANYRRKGVGTKLLTHVLDCAKKDGHYDTATLHVQTTNDAAIEFYKKFGFDVKATVEFYFPRLEPPHAFILAKSLV